MYRQHTMQDHTQLLPLPVHVHVNMCTLYSAYQVHYRSLLHVHVVKIDPSQVVYKFIHIRYTGGNLQSWSGRESTLQTAISTGTVDSKLRNSSLPLTRGLSMSKQISKAKEIILQSYNVMYIVTITWQEKNIVTLVVPTQASKRQLARKENMQQVSSVPT